MRVVLLLLVCFPFAAFSQNNFSKQVKSLIADSSNRFLQFKGAFNEISDKDSVFYASMTLEGTQKNDISFNDTSSMYFTIIADSVKEKQGKKIVAEWRVKLIEALGGKFKEEKVKVVSYNPAIDGWTFNRGSLWIDLRLYGHPSSRHLVCLSFTYSTYK